MACPINAKHPILVKVTLQNPIGKPENGSTVFVNQITDPRALLRNSVWYAQQSGY